MTYTNPINAMDAAQRKSEDSMCRVLVLKLAESLFAIDGDTSTTPARTVAVYRYGHRVA